MVYNRTSLDTSLDGGYAELAKSEKEEGTWLMMLL
jgi:hypothetical protein